MIATGTRWSVYCPCGREHHYKRPVVSVGFLNDARARIAELETQLADAISLDQHQRAIMNVMQLDMLRRCHEDRTALKQQIREIQNERQTLPRS